MGASAKTLARLTALVADGHLPIGGKIAELGAQCLSCDNASIVAFLRFFRERGVAVTIGDSDATNLGNGGYFGALLTAAGFEYTALDIFEVPSTRLFDLNLHTVSEDLRDRFALVTNYGTTEHVINQILAMRTMHDLGVPGGLLHHDLPMGGNYLHCYFAYHPGLFHDLATANGYGLVFQEISSGPRRATPDALSRMGFADRRYRDYGIEIVLKKSNNSTFRIPVDNISSATISDAAWRLTAAQGNDILVSTALPADPATFLARLPFWTLHAAYWAKLKQRFLDYFV